MGYGTFSKLLFTKFYNSVDEGCFVASGFQLHTMYLIYLCVLIGLALDTGRFPMCTFFSFILSPPLFYFILSISCHCVLYIFHTFGRKILIHVVFPEAIISLISFFDWDIRNLELWLNILIFKWVSLMFYLLHLQN